VTRLVMLPNESHSYRARESIMQMLWEQDRWLEMYVKMPNLRLVEEKRATAKLQMKANQGKRATECANDSSWFTTFYTFALICR